MKLLNCRQASELISQSHDRRLSWRERLSLRLHLVVCESCTRLLQQLDVLRITLQQLIFKTENNPELKLSKEARERMLKAMHYNGE